MTSQCFSAGRGSAPQKERRRRRPHARRHLEVPAGDALAPHDADLVRCLPRGEALRVSRGRGPAGGGPDRGLSVAGGPCRACAWRHTPTRRASNVPTSRVPSFVWRWSRACRRGAGARRRRCCGSCGAPSQIFPMRSCSATVSPGPGKTSFGAPAWRVRRTPCPDGARSARHQRWRPGGPGALRALRAVARGGRDGGPGAGPRQPRPAGEARQVDVGAGRERRGRRRGSTHRWPCHGRAGALRRAGADASR